MSWQYYKSENVDNYRKVGEWSTRAYSKLAHSLCAFDFCMVAFAGGSVDKQSANIKLLRGINECGYRPKLSSVRLENSNESNDVFTFIKYRDMDDSKFTEIVKGLCTEHKVSAILRLADNITLISDNQSTEITMNPSELTDNDFTKLHVMLLQGTLSDDGVIVEGVKDFDSIIAGRMHFQSVGLDWVK